MQEARAIIDKLGVPLSALSADSRRLPAACGFLAYPGYHDDGRRHIPAALSAGAAAVLWEAENFQWRSDWSVPNQPVLDLRSHAGLLADVVYREPSNELSVFAVTGTNGKTTICHFAAQLCEAVGAKPGLVGTLGSGTLGKLLPLSNTTPDAAVLQETLRDFVNGSVSHAMVEASSHGIKQGRLNGVRLSAAVFANASYDHLDYHQTLNDYWQSKAALFNAPNLGAAILNADDDYCAGLIKSLCAQNAMPVFGYGKNGDALRLKSLRENPDGSFVAWTDGVFGRRSFCLRVAGVYNIANFFAAALIAHVAGWPAEAIEEYAPRLILPVGRLQRLSDKPAVYVDFAHTPDAFDALLPAMRPTTGGRLLLVFGCGGERDKHKRKCMGALAAKYADVVIVTDDNPRRESAADIRREILIAVPTALEISDRKCAIAEALAQAQAGDVVLIAGKGHESTQEINNERQHFSDIQTVKALLAERDVRCE